MEDKVTQIVVRELVQICALNKVDFHSLDKNVRDSMIQVFQAGVGFMEKFGKELVS